MPIDVSQWKYKEFRCPITNKLLCKYKGVDGQIEKKHPTKQHTYYFGPLREHKDNGPKGVNFASRAVTLRCQNKNCVQVLAKVIGYDLILKVDCHRCGFENRFDLKDVHKERVRVLSETSKKIYIQRLKELF